MAAVVGGFMTWYFAEYIENSVHCLFSPRVRSRLKILISFSQIIYALPAVFEMPFPTVFEDFLVSVMSLLSFSFLTEVKGFDCLYKTTFYSQFFLACAAPLG